MHLKDLWKVFAAAAAISSCSGRPAKDYPPPDVDLGTLIYTGNLETSYGYFEPLLYEGKSGYTKGLPEMASGKYFLMSPGHYKNIQVYIETIERVARERCE